MDSFDCNLLLALQSFRDWSGDALTSFFLTVTHAGEDPLLFAIAAALYWCVSKRQGFLVFSSVIAANLLGQFLKLACAINRPWIRFPAVHPVPQAVPGATGFSFPSGHTFGSTSAMGALALIFRRDRRLLFLFAFLPLLVGFSRLYLGVHTPSDVEVGLVVGLAALAAMAGFLRFIEKRPRLDWLLPLLGTLGAAALFFYADRQDIRPLAGADGHLLVDPPRIVGDAYRTVGLVAGAAWGWFIERRWVRFDPAAGTAGAKIFRYAAGFLLTLLVASAVPGLLKPFVGTGVIRFTQMAVLILFILTGYPALIVAAGGKREAR